MLLSDIRYLTVAYLAVTLSVVFIGVKYVLGLAEFKKETIILMLVRYMALIFFLSPSGWEYYKSYIANPALNGMMFISKFLIGQFLNLPVSQIHDPLVILDYSALDYLFNLDTWIKIIALFFSGFWGWIYVIVIAWAMVYLLVIFIKAIVIYATILMLIGVLLVIGPVTFVFLIFDKTKNIFTSWLKELFSLMIQQYCLFIAIFLIGIISSEFIRNITYYGVCFSSVLNLKISIPFPSAIKSLAEGINDVSDAIGGGRPITVPEYLFYALLPIFYAYKITTSILRVPVDIAGVFGLVVISLMFQSLLSGIDQLASALTGGKVSPSNSLKPIMSGLNKLSDTVLSTANSTAIDGAKNTLQRSARLTGNALTSGARGTLALGKHIYGKHVTGKDKRSIAQKLKQGYDDRYGTEKGKWAKITRLANFTNENVFGGKSKATSTKEKRTLNTNRAFAQNSAILEKEFAKSYSEAISQGKSTEEAFTSGIDRAKRVLLDKGVVTLEDGTMKTGMSVEQVETMVEQHSKNDGTNAKELGLQTGMRAQVANHTLNGKDISVKGVKSWNIFNQKLSGQKFGSIMNQIKKQATQVANANVANQQNIQSIVEAENVQDENDVNIAQNPPSAPSGNPNPNPNPSAMASKVPTVLQSYNQASSAQNASPDNEDQPDDNESNAQEEDDNSQTDVEDDTQDKSPVMQQSAAPLTMSSVKNKYDNVVDNKKKDN